MRHLTRLSLFTLRLALLSGYAAPTPATTAAPAQLPSAAYVPPCNRQLLLPAPPGYGRTGGSGPRSSARVPPSGCPALVGECDSHLIL
jgi:hypothetical protein